MVNELQRIKDRVVKVEVAPKKERTVTVNGGLSLVQAVARRQRLVSDARRLLPKRLDPSQGFATETVALGAIHGFLSGGRGFRVTEHLREDKPTLRILGLDRAPSAETVEGVVKYIAGLEGGRNALLDLLVKQATRSIKQMSRTRLLMPDTPFIPVWADGSLLEVEGKRFDSTKCIKKTQSRGRRDKVSRGQICEGGFVGPWMTSVDFARGKEGEQTVGRRVIDEMVTKMLRPNRLMKDALILLDSLYGKEPTLAQLEEYREKPSYIVGVKGLVTAENTMQDSTEIQWRNTGPKRSRGWDESWTAVMWLQCKDWPEKRQMVCRRWRNVGECILNHAGVVTNLEEGDRRIQKLMRTWNMSFEEVIWRLYDYKQGMEVRWKDLLIDLGLHHPPCAKAQVNATFFILGALAYNLSLAVREFTLKDSDRRMRLWRFRQEFIHVAAKAFSHARNVTVRLVDACDRRVEQLSAAMLQVSRL